MMINLGNEVYGPVMSSGLELRMNNRSLSCFIVLMAIFV